MLGKLFANNREEVLFPSRAKLSLAKKLDVSCLCKISNIAVIVAGKGPVLTRTNSILSK